MLKIVNEVFSWKGGDFRNWIFLQILITEVKYAESQFGIEFSNHETMCYSLEELYFGKIVILQSDV